MSAPWAPLAQIAGLPMPGAPPGATKLYNSVSHLSLVPPNLGLLPVCCVSVLFPFSVTKLTILSTCLVVLGVRRSLVWGFHVFPGWSYQGLDLTSRPYEKFSSSSSDTPRVSLK